MPLKRLTYISKYDPRIFPGDTMQQLVRQSADNNERMGVTGIMMGLSGIFFQTLEGDEQAVTSIYTKICKDDRHYDLVILRMELEVTTRLYPDWSMKDINVIEEDKSILMEPIKSLLTTVAHSHRVLEKYTQPLIMNMMQNGVNPLSLPIENNTRIIMFCDIMSYSSFSEVFTSRTIITMLNRYFTVISAVVEKYGGRLNKYIGDCVLAYFLPEDDGASRAVAASIEILQQLKDLRDSIKDRADPTCMLNTGIGLAYGECIEGNIGSNSKMDYTIIGDAVNTAARLEAKTRDVGYHLLFDEAVANAIKSNSPYYNTLITLGEIKVKGKADYLNVYSIHCSSAKKDLGKEISSYVTQYSPSRKRMIANTNVNHNATFVHHKAPVSPTDTNDQNIETKSISSSSSSMAKDNEQQIDELKKRIELLERKQSVGFLGWFKRRRSRNSIMATQ
jgi:adenylate cyclase